MNNLSGYSKFINLRFYLSNIAVELCNKFLDLYGEAYGISYVGPLGPGTRKQLSVFIV